jgi:hypothetical protein
MRKWPTHWSGLTKLLTQKTTAFFRRLCSLSLFLSHSFSLCQCFCLSFSLFQFNSLSFVLLSLSHLFLSLPLIFFSFATLSLCLSSISFPLFFYKCLFLLCTIPLMVYSSCPLVSRPNSPKVSIMQLLNIALYLISTCLV